MGYQIPRYRPQIFTGREKIIQVIQDYIKPDPNRKSGSVTVITGERGSGKTYFSMQLHRSEFPKVKIRSYLVHLLPLSPNEKLENAIDEYAVTDSQESVQETLTKILRKIAIWIGVGRQQIDSASVEEYSSWITNAIQDQPGQQFAFLFDSAFEASWILLEKLEKYLLAPAVSYPNVAILITGRGQPYPWTSAYLRTEILNIQLEHFTEEETRDALSKLEKDKSVLIDPLMDANIIFEQTRGHPLMTVLRAQKASWKQIVDELMAVMPKDERSLYTSYLAALTPLDGFRDEAIEPMLNAYLGEGYTRNWGSKKANQVVREPLADLRLISWKDGKFVLDPDLRWALYKYLLEEADSEVWNELNKEAEKLYRRWSEKYPRVQKYFIAQAELYQEQAREGTLVIN